MKHKWLALLLVLPLVIGCKCPQGVVVVNSELREAKTPDGRQVRELVVVVENRTGQKVVVDYHVFHNCQFLAASENQQIFPSMANNQKFQVPLVSGYNSVLLFVNTNVPVYPANARSFVVYAP
jgi:hypothetical protein